MRKSDRWRQIWDFLKATITYEIIEKIVRYVAYLFKTTIKMKCVDIPDQIKIDGFSIKSLIDAPDFSSIDRGIIDGTISESSKVPDCGRYKLISFHSDRGGISTFDLGIILRLFAYLRSWKTTTLAEVIAVGQSCNFKDLGLEQKCTIAALGTTIQKSSVLSSWLSWECFPVVDFENKEVNGKKIKEKGIHLHDFSHDYPNDQYILVRVD